MESEFSFMDFNFFDVAQNGCFSVLNIALNNLDLYNFDVNCQDAHGNTLLHYIAAKGNIETASKLLNLNAYTNILNSKGETPLHLACLGGHLNIAKLLLDQKSNLNALDYKGESPIFKSIKSGNSALTKFLIGKGANLKQINRNEENLLHLAAKFGDKSLVKMLIRFGVSLAAVTSYGDDAVRLALKNFSEDTLGLLLEQKDVDLERVDERKCTLLHLSVKLNHKKACEKLIRLNLNINSQDIDGSTPLHLAAEFCHLDILNLLLRNGANVNQQDHDGYTPLHVAAGVPLRRSNSQEVILALIKYGADSEALSCHGDLPLHRAAACGNGGAVVLLFKRKLSDCRNFSGLSPLDVAEANGRNVIVMLLKTLNDNLHLYCDENDNFHESTMISEIICHPQTHNNDGSSSGDENKNKDLHNKTLIPILKRRSDVGKSLRNP